MTRLIDADALRDALIKKSEFRLDPETHMAVRTLKINISEAIRMVNEQSTVNQWIPCSERLPEENVAVNITWVNHDPVLYYKDIKDKPFTATGVYFKGKWYWWTATVQDYLAEYGRYDFEEFDEAIECIAWMPLPKPYEEE